MSAPATVSDVAVDPDLTRRLTAAGRKAEEWRERRDELIREAARDGGTLREIAAMVGLTHVGVLRIIRRGGELEVVHDEPMHSTTKAQDENTVFMTPTEHMRRDRGDA